MKTYTPEELQKILADHSLWLTDNTKGTRADLWGANGLDIWWHVHHEILTEQLTEPVRNRINYIKSDKPKDEIELRLKLLKPVLGKVPSTPKGWESLHKKECGCGWNKKTIFTKKNGLAK